MAKKKPKYWLNGKIPADLFFEILSEGDKKLLLIKGRVGKAKLEKAWEDIFDEFYVLKDDPKLRLITRTQETIRFLKHKISICDNVLMILSMVDFPKQHLKQIKDSLNKIDIHIDIESPIHEQIINLKDFKLAHLNTELLLEEDNLKGLCEGEKSNYEDSLVGIEDALGRSVGESISLRKYCALEKRAKALSKQRNRKNKNKK